MLYTTLDIRIQESQDLIPLFLIASYAYYEKKETLMADETFDLLAARILAEWDSLDHPYKSLISKENLQTQSTYDLSYPESIVAQAQALLAELKGA